MDRKKSQNLSAIKKEISKRMISQQSFCFWVRLKISKNRTTLIIGQDTVKNKKTNKIVAGFAHREATIKYHKGVEGIKPKQIGTKQIQCI